LNRDQLIETGKKRGYVLYSDLDALLAEDYEGGPELDDLLAALESASVEIRNETNIRVDRVPETIEGFSDDPIQVYLNEVGKVPQLTREGEIELAKVIQAGDPEAETAKRQLTEASLRLVVPVAERYATGAFHLLELIQEGNNGLMLAVDKYDHTRGYRFSTYATWWARRFIIRATR
jgi:RNA polymerase primary sigma factor